MNRLKRIGNMSKCLIRLIQAYRRLFANKPPSCRFTPTCSQYAIEAIGKYGAFRGGLMGLWRILRCNPFNKGGYDPVK